MFRQAEVEQVAIVHTEYQILREMNSKSALLEPRIKKYACIGHSDENFEGDGSD